MNALLNNEEGSTKRTSRKRRQQWIEPKRSGGPTLTARAVATILGYTDVERVHQLVESGPEVGGLAGYIPGPGGRGWRRKTGRGFSNVTVMFYELDVNLWAEQHPIKEEMSKHIEYTQEQAAVIMREADQIRYEDGSVNRAELTRRLIYVPGTYNKENGYRGVPRTEPGYGSKLWNARTYKVIKQILDDNAVGLSPAQRKNTSVRRQY